MVYFDNVVDGEAGCEVGEAEKMYIDGKLHDLWTFSVGYDDLWDKDPLGNEVVKETGFKPIPISSSGVLIQDPSLSINGFCIYF